MARRTTCDHYGQKLAEEKKKTRKNQQQTVKEAQNALKGQFAKKVKKMMEKQEKN
ncbi:MAG: hypothetical protein H9W80_06220 [Enterococcus sp.]|nr:hypothetical protein [Enterococcus sp.]